jgi:cell division protein FtsI (penicillin-binding protein 3)
MSAGRRRGLGDLRGGRVLRFVRRLPTRPAALDPLRRADRPDPAFEGCWRDGIKRRTIVVLSFLGLWATAVEARLVQLQVFQHAKMLEEALREEQETIHPVGVRGGIVDRYGQVLACSVPAYAIVATPREISATERAKTIDELCQALSDCSASDREELRATLSTSRSFAYVRRSGAVSPSQAERLRGLKLKGIALMPDTQRYYPNRELAAHVLGFVGQENRGLAGIEFADDELIRGQPGTARVQVDARGHGMETRVDQAPTTGATVELTLDLYLQHIAERELAAGVEAHHADAGTAVIMDPRTGQILAIANVPTFNPNAYEQSSADARRNRAVQDEYEPGSTFKIVTVSAALQERIWSLSDLIDTAPGYLQIGSRRIHDSEGHNNGVLSVEDVVVKSSNVGAGKIGLRVGAELMERYVQRFGFGHVLLPDLTGQSAGRVYGINELNESALASMSIGYQIGVTPVQMATAVSVVANGGTLYQPQLVRALVRDGERQAIEPKVIRQAITPETAATLRSILEQVVIRGTGTKAAVEGFSVGGKTGTAAKIINHAYSETAYNASFVGFVPSSNPVLTIVVVVDTPRGGSYFGGDVAAPIFSRIADAALRHLRVLPTVASRVGLVVTPPAPPAILEPPAPVAQPIVLRSADAPGPRMPDVRGLTAREALRALDAAGLVPRLTGSGVVTAQTPKAGDPISAGEVSSLQFGRPASSEIRSPVGGGVR